MIEQDRIDVVNDRPEVDGRYVLYWMQASHRTHFNHALEHAVRLANARGQPVVVAFGLTDSYPAANARHYAFMLDGLADVASALAARGVRFVLRRGDPAEVAIGMARAASVLVVDRGYLRCQRQWRARVAEAVCCRMVEVESDVVVPVETASDKREYAARTLRPKLRRLWPSYLGGLSTTPVNVPSIDMDGLMTQWNLEPGEGRRLLARLNVDRSVPPVPGLAGGEREAQQRLNAFLRDVLPDYRARRGDPNAMHVSTLSPYLHFGQVSPVDIARRVLDADAPQVDRDAFLEELIVRRELAVNFVWFTRDYDRWSALPEWARRSLHAHRGDPRPAVYNRRQLEAGETTDVAWNAAMRQMRGRGYLHNHMRMYWGKKILEWSADPEDAFETVLVLNDRWFMDGRDPNSYANVGWLFGLHDRPWPERPVFGQVRAMAASGLRRKFDVDAFVRASPSADDLVVPWPGLSDAADRGLDD